MTTAVQRRRGTSTEHATFTGLDGEITVNTTTYTLHIHDGATVGGVALAKADGSNLVTSSIDINGGTIDGTVIGGSSAAAGSFTTISASGEIAANGGIALPDNQKATFGASDDLQIYHDGSNSFISDQGTGRLGIQTSGLTIQNAAGTGNYITAEDGAEVGLRYNNVQKLATTATGIDVTGTVTADGLNVNATQATLSNDGSNYLLVERTTSGSEGRLYVGVTSSKNQIVSYSGTSGTAGKDLTIEQGNAIGKAVTVHSNNDISFYEDTGTTAKFFWDASAESLGIGTTSPATLNHISAGYAAPTGGIDSNIKLLVSNSSSGANYVGFGLLSGNNGGSFIHFGDTDDMDVGAIAYFHDNNRMEFTVNGSEAMRIDSAGNVGIGEGAKAHFGGTTYSGSHYIKYNSGNNGLEINSYGSTIFTNTSSSTERMRINSSGNVGIGTSSPAYPLDVHGGTIGVTSASAFAGLQITSANSSFGYINFGDPQDGNIGQIQYDHTSNFMKFTTNNAERMRIDSSGNLLVGATNNAGMLTGASVNTGFSVEGGGTWYNQVNSGPNSYMSKATGYTNGEMFSFWVSGSKVGSIAVTGSATSYNTSSDYRLKENVVPMDNASDRVLALKPCRFNFITDPDKTVDGFLAHEAQEVVPEAVTGSKDAMRTEEYEVSPAVLDEEGNVVTEAVMGTREVPDYQGIDQSKLTPLLTKALQEALTEIANLKARVNALETN